MIDYKVFAWAGRPVHAIRMNSVMPETRAAFHFSHPAPA
jgi:hypothetical protein